MQLADIRAKLVRRRRQLLARYRDELDRADEELEPHEIERACAATEQWDAHVLLVLGDTDARALLEVVGAIRRLDEGSYGTCSGCGARIATVRLEVLPATALCFPCADRSEHTAVPAGSRSSE